MNLPGASGDNGGRLFWLADHPLQGRHLAEELGAGLRRASQQDGARGSVRNDPSLGADLRAPADAQMPRHGRLAADLDEILEYRRAGDAYLSDDDAAAADADIVADLHQIIETRAS